MTDQQPREDQTRDTWQDVGKEFEQLGGASLRRCAQPGMMKTTAAAHTKCKPGLK